MMQVTDCKRKRTDIAWKPDNTLLAVGHEDGLVMLLVKSSSASLHSLPLCLVLRFIVAVIEIKLSLYLIKYCTLEMCGRVEA
jgi:hypothetical protein